MSSGHVPSAGPVLDGEATTALKGVRQSTTTIAGGAAAAATTEVFRAATGGLPISVRTRAANEQVRATMSLSRIGDILATNGTYQFTVDGVAAGSSRQGPAGSSLAGFTMDAVLTIAAPGVHTIGANVTGNDGSENVLAGAQLVVEANEFA